MANYDGTTFTVLAFPGTGGVYLPAWARERNVSVAHIPYSSADDVQSAGVGDWTIQVDALLAGEAALQALQAREATTAGALTGLRWSGDDYPEAYLEKVDSPRTLARSTAAGSTTGGLVYGTGLVRATLTFRRPDAGVAATGGITVPVLVAAFAADTSVPGEVTIDPNAGTNAAGGTGSTSSDGFFDVLNVEWGDGTYTILRGAAQGAPWAQGALPTPTHPYAAPGQYQINLSLQRGSAISPDESQIVTVN